MQTGFGWLALLQAVVHLFMWVLIKNRAKICYKCVHIGAQVDRVVTTWEQFFSWQWQRARQQDQLSKQISSFHLEVVSNILLTKANS